MNKFKVGDKVKILNAKLPWYMFITKHRLKYGNLVGWINRDLEHLLMYEIYTNHGIWLVYWDTKMELLNG
jgi:hypothetical protein